MTYLQKCSRCGAYFDVDRTHRFQCEPCQQIRAREIEELSRTVIPPLPSSAPSDP